MKYQTKKKKNKKPIRNYFLIHQKNFLGESYVHSVASLRSRTGSFFSVSIPDDDLLCGPEFDEDNEDANAKAAEKERDQNQWEEPEQEEEPKQEEEQEEEEEEPLKRKRHARAENAPHASNVATNAERSTQEEPRNAHANNAERSAGNAYLTHGTNTGEEKAEMRGNELEIKRGDERAADLSHAQRNSYLLFYIIFGAYYIFLILSVKV